jgi:hypothetical protein
MIVRPSGASSKSTPAFGVGYSTSSFPCCKTPSRYRDRPFPGPTAKEFINGLLEAFEPDFRVETQKGLAARLSFPEKRIIEIDDVL